MDDLLLRRRVMMAQSNSNRDYSKEYLTLEFVYGSGDTSNSGQLIFNHAGSPGAKTIQYRKNSGSWNDITTWGYTASSINVQSGDIIELRCPNPINSIGAVTAYATSETVYRNIYATIDFVVYGNIMSLAHGDYFVGKVAIPANQNYYFCNLFRPNSSSVSQTAHLISAENLILPATTLILGCYDNLFRDCRKLITSPKKLPAVTTANTTTAGATYCYAYMFRGCQSLVTTPEINLTALSGYCMHYMFYGCTSLTAAPELKATLLAAQCYRSMFQGCTALTTAPELKATVLKSNCYRSMFQDCTALTTAPDLIATSLTSNCYYQMFYGCSSLNYIKAMFTTTPSTSYTSSWVSGVASTGTFVKNSAATWTTTGVNGIPSGWTVQTASS